jgi:hypothetical protein
VCVCLFSQGAEVLRTFQALSLTPRLEWFQLCSSSPYWEEEIERSSISFFATPSSLFHAMRSMFHAAAAKSSKREFAVRCLCPTTRSMGKTFTPLSDAAVSSGPSCSSSSTSRTAVPLSTAGGAASGISGREKENETSLAKSHFSTVSMGLWCS